MKVKKNIAAAIVLLGIAVLAVLAVVLREETETRVDFLMDTFVEQRLTGRDAKKTGEAVYNELKKFEQELSAYDADSYITQINAAAGKSYVKVSPQTYALLKRSAELSAMSYGAFDASIGPLSALWHGARENGVPPESAEIEQKLALVDYKKILFDDENTSVMLAESGMALDLGGIAKGYACDIARGIYEEAKLQTGLLSIGGNVYTYRAPRGEKGYRIGIKNPDESGINPLLALQTTGEVIATSGAYERYFEYEGIIYHHILDKKTGMPSRSDLKSVSIITSDGALADYLSTTLFVLGKGAVLQALENEEAAYESGEAPAFMMIAIDDGNNIYTSRGVKARLELLDNKNYRLV